MSRRSVSMRTPATPTDLSHGQAIREIKRAAQITSLTQREFVEQQHCICPCPEITKLEIRIIYDNHKNPDFDICTCGHIRRAHCNNSGTCDEVSYQFTKPILAEMPNSLAGKCSCAHFKHAPKPPRPPNKSTLCRYCGSDLVLNKMFCRNCKRFVTKAR